MGECLGRTRDWKTWSQLLWREWPLGEGQPKITPLFRVQKDARQQTIPRGRLNDTHYMSSPSKMYILWYNHVFLVLTWVIF